MRKPIHHREFMPRGGEVSVAHITGLAEQDIWDLGKHTLNTSAARTQVRGRADLGVAAITAINLRVVRDDSPFDRHSRIDGWPEGEDADLRHKELAKELAEAAKPVIRPCP